jgi:hypothetical protein
MDALRRLLVGIRLILGRHSARVWFLWGLAVVLLALAPFALLDPAAWVFVLDPELAAIVALVGLAGMRAGALRVFRRPLLALARLPHRT